MGGESAAAFMIMNRSLSKKGWCVVVLIMTLYAQVAMGHSDMDSCKSDVSTATENVLQSLKVLIMGTMGGPKMWATDLCYMYFVVVDAHNLQRKLRMTLFLFCRRSCGVQSIRSSQIAGILFAHICSNFFHTTRL